MDVKKQITDAVDKITKDKTLQEEFKKNPVKAVEKATGVDLPDDVINKIVDGVKAKISIDKIGDLAGNLKKLF